MARLAILGILALGLLGFAGYSGFVTWVVRPNQALDGDCMVWLEQPAPRWLALRGCTLAVDELMLESRAGDLETLANRAKGLSRKVYDAPPEWVAAWAPVSGVFDRGSQIRAVYRVESRDVMAWLNAFERADERKREAMWSDPAVLRRIARPGVLLGEARRPSSDALQKAWGGRVATTLLTVIPGQAPEPSFPVPAVLAGLLGLVLLIVTYRQLGGAAAGHLAPASAEQELTALNVKDVKVDIGELERLREEERVERRSKR